MRPYAFWLCAGTVLSFLACAPVSPPNVAPTEPTADTLAGDDATETEGGIGGAEGDGNLLPTKLTGLPGIDRAQDLEVRILDARGTGRLGAVAVPAGQSSSMELDRWLLTDAGSEYEITLRNSLMPDGIVRLRGQSAFLIQSPNKGALPGFRVFGGSVSFYFRHVSLGEITVLTPAGPLVTRGAVFTVTVSPDFQVLVTCREGAVYLTGGQNAVAQPGQVLVADGLGRGRLYPMTPNEALVFSERWLTIMSEESTPVVKANLPRRLAAWNSVSYHHEPERARFLALWFRVARTVLGDRVPGPEAWMATLASDVSTSVWSRPYPTPSLLGETP